MQKYGFNDAAWDAAKAEGKAVLVNCARSGDVIAYSDFIKHIRSISFETAHDPRLPHFLREISEEETQAGRGMLTALVVHKHGDYQPGPGFFELAEKLGYNTDDVEKFWIIEVKKIFAAWQKT